MAFSFLFVWSPTPDLQVSLGQKVAIWWSRVQVAVDAEKTFFFPVRKLSTLKALNKTKQKKKKSNKFKNMENLVAMQTMLGKRVFTVRISGKREKSPVTW